MANRINAIKSIANNATNAIPRNLSILITIPASFSVLLTLSTKTCLISLSNNSSILIFNVFDKSFNCSGLGAVSPNSQFEIVCLVTFTCSPNCSCERLFFFLYSKILFPNDISITPFKDNYRNLYSPSLPNSFGTLSKTFNILINS